MSLLLVWSNDESAHVLSDGLSLAPDGSIVSTTRKKFFRTAAGHLVGACGFTHLRSELARRFADSLANFDDLVTGIGKFVYETNRKHQATAQSKPLGAVVVGIEGGRVRSANIHADDIEFSRPSWPSVHWLTAAESDSPTMLEVARDIYAARPETVEETMRSGAQTLFREFAGRMGGKVFEASIFAEDCDALSSQGSLVAGGTNLNFSNSFTDSSISVWNTAFSVPLPNGTSQSIPATGSSTSPAWSFTGLAASTTYYFGGYYDLITGKVVVVMSDNQTSPGSQTWLVQTIQGDNKIPLFTSWPISTAATGGSGGGTGGGSDGGSTCPAEDQEIETRERGFIAAGELRPGMHVRGWQNEWNRIEEVRLVEGFLHHVTIGGEAFHVDLNHGWLPVGVSPDAPLSQWKRSAELKPSDEVQSADGDTVPVEEVGEPHRGKYVEIRAERQRFRLGKIMAHNYFTYTL